MRGHTVRSISHTLFCPLLKQEWADISSWFPNSFIKLWCCSKHRSCRSVRVVHTFSYSEIFITHPCIHSHSHVLAMTEVSAACMSHNQLPPGYSALEQVCCQRDQSSVQMELQLKGVTQAGWQMVHSLADLLGSTVLKKEGSSRHEWDSLTYPTLPGIHCKYLQPSNNHQRGETRLC